MRRKNDRARLHAAERVSHPIPISGKTGFSASL